MSTFKNRLTGDVVTAFGPVHDNYAARLDYELVHADRGGEQDTEPQPDVLDDEPEDIEDTEPSYSQDDPNPADDASDNSRSTK